MQGLFDKYRRQGLAPNDAAAKATEELSSSVIMPMAPRIVETPEPSSPSQGFETPPAPAIESPEPVPIIMSRSMSFEIEPGTGEALCSRQHSEEPAKTDGVLVYVKNGFMYAYGKVGEVLISIKVKIEGERELAMAKVVESYALVKAQVEKYGVTLQGYTAKLEGKALLVKGKVMDGVVCVKAKSIAARELAKTRATAGYEIITSRATAGYDVVKLKINAGYVQIITAVQSFPVPMKVKSGALCVQGKMGDLFVYLRNGVMYVQGRVGDALVSVQVKGVASYELAAAKAHGAFASVAAAVEPYTKKTSEGLVTIKGKVNGVVVQIRTKAAEKVEAARGACEIAQKAIADRVNSGKAIATDKATMVTDKVRATVIYAKEGYVHIVSRASEKTLYIRAKVSTVGGEVRVKVLEAYVNVETLTFKIVDHLTAILERTRARAADKPAWSAVMRRLSKVQSGMLNSCAHEAFGRCRRLFCDQGTCSCALLATLRAQVFCQSSSGAVNVSFRIRICR
jgi:hypothetical protein